MAVSGKGTERDRGQRSKLGDQKLSIEGTRIDTVQDVAYHFFEPHKDMLGREESRGTGDIDGEELVESFISQLPLLFLA